MDEPSMTTSASGEEIITLNVGGQIFQTTSTTVLMDEQSMLAAMFGSRNHKPRVIDGAYFIDRDPAYFRPVLNFLRTNQVILDPNVNPNGVLAEAMYFGVQSMVDAIRQMQDEALGGPDRAELTRGDLVRLIASSGLHSRLRLQGVNLSGLDLSRLDLGNVNLSMANLSYCDLSYTTLINSTLTKCNLQHARMVHCNCNQANLVGADLMATDLSHSNFMVANFTGATLRNSEGLTDEEKTLAQERGAQF